MVTKRANGSETGIDEPENGGGTTVISIDADDLNVERDGIPIADPIAGASDPEPTRNKKRGRPTGWRKSDAGKSKTQTPTDLTGVLISLHFMAATFLKVPELNLEKEEAKKLSDAVQRVNAEYGMPVLTPKQEAWLNLGIVGLSTYGPRVAAHLLNQKAERDKAASAAAGPKPVTIDGTFARAN